MYRGGNKILILIALLLVLVACVLFLQRSTDWWKHPGFDGSIKAIAIYDGQFRMPEDKPIITLNQTSEDAGKVIESLENARFYRKWAKFESFVNIYVIYKDCRVDNVFIGSDFIEFFPHGCEKSEYYKIRKKDSDSIRNIVMAPPRGAEGGGGSEEINP